MNSYLIPVSAIKGRGAAERTAHRFAPDARQPLDDGWPGDDEWAPHPVATEVIEEDAKSIITRNDSPDIHFDTAINPYRGCEHGCVYCYARPTHSYLNLSPGLDFETRIIAKRNIATVLRAELSARRYQAHSLNLGSATDCYQPVERSLRLTRQVIELLHETQHAFSLITKSAGVERDLDLLLPMARHGLVAVYVTVTTLDADLARRLEPRAASPLRRLRTIRTLAEAGIPVGVSVAPQIPFLNEDMEQVLQAAREAGAGSAFYTVLRLPWELSGLFQQWLQLHYPQRAQRVMARIQELRGGADYDARYGLRMSGQGTWAALLQRRFEVCTRRLGLNQHKTVLDLSRFRPPAAPGQGQLF